LRKVEYLKKKESVIQTTKKIIAMIN